MTAVARTVEVTYLQPRIIAASIQAAYARTKRKDSSWLARLPVYRIVPRAQSR